MQLLPSPAPRSLHWTTRGSGRRGCSALLRQSWLSHLLRGTKGRGPPANQYAVGGDCSRCMVLALGGGEHMLVSSGVCCLLCFLERRKPTPRRRFFVLCWENRYCLFFCGILNKCIAPLLSPGYFALSPIFIFFKYLVLLLFFLYKRTVIIIKEKKGELIF